MDLKDLESLDVDEFAASSSDEESDSDVTNLAINSKKVWFLSTNDDSWRSVEY